MLTDINEMQSMPKKQVPTRNIARFKITELYNIRNADRGDREEQFLIPSITLA